MEGKEWVTSFIPVQFPPGTVLERTVILDDADTLPSEVICTGVNVTGKQRAHEISTGGLKPEVLQGMAMEFKETVGNVLCVVGDGSCWLYSLLAPFGVIEHCGSELVCKELLSELSRHVQDAFPLYNAPMLTVFTMRCRACQPTVTLFSLEN